MVHQIDMRLVRWLLTAAQLFCPLAIALAKPHSEVSATIGVSTIDGALAGDEREPRARLETIVVTAQKRPQRIQDVPTSVSVIEAADLLRTGTFDAGTVEQRAPNLEVDVDAQEPVIGIRGFSTDTDNVGFEPAVGLQIDEVALARSEFLADGLFDLRRIEVLRGPQGTLFGKNTVAGVMAFESVTPQPEWSGSLQATMGPRSSGRVQAAQNVPLGNSAAMRVAGVHWNRTGSLHNLTLGNRVNDFRQNAGRATVHTHPTDRLDIELATQVSETSGSYGPTQWFDASANALDFGRRYDAQLEDDPFNEQTSLDQPGTVDRGSDLTRLQLDYDFNGALGTSELSSRLILAHAGVDVDALIDADVSPASLVITDFGVDHRQSSLEWRLLGQSGSLFGVGEDVDFLFGVYASTADLKSNLDALAGGDLIPFGLSPAGIEALGGPGLPGVLTPFEPLPELPDLPINDSLLREYGQSSNSLAAFGQVEWRLDTSWSVLLGARITRERKRARFNVSSTGLGLISLLLNADDFQAQRRRSETDVSPRLGLIYRLDDRARLFATTTRGFKGGGFDATANTDQDLEFEPERATSFEAGVKAVGLAGSWRAQLSLYQTTVTDLQVVDLLGNALQVSNAARARLRGAEAEVSWLPGASRLLRIDASVGRSQAIYLRYRDAVPTAGQARNGLESQDLSGRTLPNAPEWSAFLSPTVIWRAPFGSALEVEMAMEAAYRGEHYSATDLDPRSRQSGYWLFGASAVLGDPRQGWAVVASLRNLTDRKALDQVSDNAVYVDTYTAEQIPVRSMLLSLVVNW